MRRRLLSLVLLVACADPHAGSQVAPSPPAKPVAPTPAPAAPTAPVAPSAPTAASSKLQSIALPGGEGGIGLDDLSYAPVIGRVLAPAGRTGNLDLIDPATGAVEAIAGFGGQDGSARGHGAGSTSATEGAGLLFAIDRTRRQVDIVDPAHHAIVAQTALAAGPDYVRIVPSTREVWVTEPNASQIEVFRLAAQGPPSLAPVTIIAVPGGPESLIFDVTRGRAYTHLWTDTTLAIDLAKHEIVARWPNGCGGSRGIALDEAHGFLFVGCEEGRATVLDVAHDGKQLGSAPTGAGVDILAYDATRRHLYVPGGDAGTLTILGVSEQGALSVLATLPAVDGAQGVTTDGHGQVFVGDPAGGRLLVLRDETPAGG